MLRTRILQPASDRFIPMKATGRRIVIGLVLLVVTVHAGAAVGKPSQQLSPSSRQEVSAGSRADVTGIKTIVAAFYQAISAQAGGSLDRVRLNSLFVTGGRIAIGIEPSGEKPATVLLRSPDEYAVLSDQYTATKGFFDRNVANQIELFGVMAHVYSTYESRNDPADPHPMARGIKSIELLRSADRWYIVQVYWDSERAGNPIPPRYLRNHLN